MFVGGNSIVLTTGKISFAALVKHRARFFVKRRFLGFRRWNLRTVFGSYTPVHSKYRKNEQAEPDEQSGKDDYLNFNTSPSEKDDGEDGEDENDQGDYAQRRACRLSNNLRRVFEKALKHAGAPFYFQPKPMRAYHKRTATKSASKILSRAMGVDLSGPRPGRPAMECLRVAAHTEQ